MNDTEDIIYETPPTDPNDLFWLEQGKKMVESSIDAVREAAKSLLTGLSLLQGVYLGILGFADFIPADMPLPQKALFTLPLVLWLVAIYFSLEVMMTEKLAINLNAPDDIREQSEDVLNKKQRDLLASFMLLAAGLVSALLLLILCLP